MSTATADPVAGQPPGRDGGPGLVLELDQVVKVYPSSPPVTALAGVSLAVAAGELVAVRGPSGSGKTTLLHLMGTLDRPSSGSVRVTGLEVVAAVGPGPGGAARGQHRVRVPAVLPVRARHRAGQRR